MPKPATSPRCTAVVAIAMVAIALPMLPAAQAHEPAKKTHAARMHWQQHQRYRVAHSELHGPAPYAGASYDPARPRCALPYQNQFPPCMSTWPQGSPDYHGTNR